MEPYVDFTGVVVPLNKTNVDTDQIIPKQYLKSIKRTGFGINLFDQWRYLNEGALGQDHSLRPENPDFVLNKAPYRNGTILVAGENFGCGSSREHAPWALAEYGFKVVIAPSFADIFYNNSFKNGLLLIQCDAQTVAELMKNAEHQPGYALSVSLSQQRLSDGKGFEQGFDINPFLKMALLEGLDDIGLTLKEVDAIKAYEQHRKTITPWLFSDVE